MNRATFNGVTVDAPAGVRLLLMPLPGGPTRVCQCACEAREHVAIWANGAFVGTRCAAHGGHDYMPLPPSPEDVERIARLFNVPADIISGPPRRPNLAQRIRYGVIDFLWRVLVR